MSALLKSAEDSAKTKTDESSTDKPESDALDALSFLLPPSEDAVLVDSRKPIATLKHKRVRSFSVGKFNFVDHKLNLYTMEEAAEFRKVFDGLEPQDKAAIVTLNMDAIAASEQNFAESTPIRGNLAAAAIKDPKAVS